LTAIRIHAEIQLADHRKQTPTAVMTHTVDHRKQTLTVVKTRMVDRRKLIPIVAKTFIVDHRSLMPTTLNVLNRQLPTGDISRMLT
jgi:hypothetical protein